MSLAPAFRQIMPAMPAWSRALYEAADRGAGLVTVSPVAIITVAEPEPRKGSIVYVGVDAGTDTWVGPEFLETTGCADWIAALAGRADYLCLIATEPVQRFYDDMRDRAVRGERVFFVECAQVNEARWLRYCTSNVRKDATLQCLLGTPGTDETPCDPTRMYSGENLIRGFMAWSIDGSDTVRVVCAGESNLLDAAAEGARRTRFLDDLFAQLEARPNGQPTKVMFGAPEDLAFVSTIEGQTAFRRRMPDNAMRRRKLERVLADQLTALGM